MLKALAIALALLGGSGASLAAPIPVPRVSGVDQSPTLPANWGRCTTAVEASARQTSQWCKFDRLRAWPSGPSPAAIQALKFGRHTIYRGPVWAASMKYPSQKSACNTNLAGSDGHANVAVSTKYLKTYDGGWAPEKGACGKCVCIRVHGGDIGYNVGLQTPSVSPHIGLSFMGRVADRCGECPDDSLDILQDRPYSYAPDNGDNRNAAEVNKIPGPRGFTKPGAPESVGTWVADWQFVPCTWTHSQCAKFMASYGYKTFTPNMTTGI